MVFGRSVPSATWNWLKFLVRRPARLDWYKHWRGTLKAGRSPLSDELPWMVYEAIDWLQSYLEPEMQVFEWGSGGSTLFFSSRVGSVTSVEHDPTWHSIVLHQLQRRDIQNAHLVLCEPERGQTLPEAYTSTDERYKGLSFQRYVEAIDIYPDVTFDLVVVDGRARPGCMLHAVAKIRSGGYLLLDNADREEYVAGTRMVSGWPSLEFYGPGPYNEGCWATTVWQKPPGCSIH